MGDFGAEAFFEKLTSNLDEVLAALATQGSACGYPVYASIDVRDSGWKVCAVDVNLFPAGFNNLDKQDLQRAADKMRQFLSHKLGTTPPWKVAVIPEAHTNNEGYLENLCGILKILRASGCETRLAWSGQPIPKPWTLKTRHGVELTYLPAQEALEGVDAVLLNHDLSGGVPAFLKDVRAPIFPSPSLGWYRRRKSKHFEITEGLLKNLQKKIPWFDPWYFRAETRRFTDANFQTDEGLEMLAMETDQLLKHLARDYEKRGIPNKPSVFIKNDAGTYGLGILHVNSGEELLTLGRSARNKMRMGKESTAITQVILQETIPTAFTYLQDSTNPDSVVAGEPCLYMVNGLPVGGFIRLHEKLGRDAAVLNLNQPGSLLESIGQVVQNCSSRPFPKPRNRCPRDEIDGKFVYYFLCKLHVTAAGLEECPS